MIRLLFLSLVLSLAACTPNKNHDKTLALIEDAQNIVSTRGSDPDRFFTLIKLKSPALLEQARRINGVTVVDLNLKAQIEAEQSLALKELQKLDASVQVVYRYKMVLNAIAVVGPQSIFDKLGSIGVITAFEKVSDFERLQISGKVVKDLNLRNSVKFIGATQLHQQGLKGQGMKVGVLDTGIDYTHSMFGGAGTSAAYQAIDPAVMNSAFPSAQVVGGVDLVGTDYNSSSLDFAFHIPKPDLNPLDEGGHGSHVAGTIAGHGDGVNSYDGVAPDASLYAIKVFGARGSTSDMVVIAGLEFAADPDGNGVLNDQLDVVNLSLGSSYGSAKLLYAEAIKNLVHGGTSAVISAGNSGNKDYIVGSPGASTEALSVAASIDDADHNWRFETSLITIGTEKHYVKAMQALTSKPISEEPLVSGEFVHVGLADQDIPASTGVSGKVALIDRGGVSFEDKIKRAQTAGAIGVVVVNNSAAAPINMSTTTPFSIPAIMISLELGNKIKAALTATPVVAAGVDFLGDQPIETPELIDTMTSFSSKGPRSVDGYLKPEITAPGYQIISADMGEGNKVTQMSGTSMAAPHMAGVMALMKQNFKNKNLDLTPLELKNIAMGHAKTLSTGSQVYPVTRQGSGRVQADQRMMKAVIVANKPSIALGEVSIDSQRRYLQAVIFKNLSTAALKLSFVFEGHPGVKLAGAHSISLDKGKTIPVLFNLEINARLAKKEVEEFDGWIKVLENNIEIYRLPFLAVVHQQSKLKSTVKNLEVTIENKSAQVGSALLFNLLAVDERKPKPASDKSIFNTDCDLESAGYRMVQRDGKTYIQFAIKTYKIMTTWQTCDVSILFDADNDGQTDQELVSLDTSSIPGVSVENFASVLIDTIAAQKIRSNFELEIKKVLGQPAQLEDLKSQEDYSPAILDEGNVQVYEGSTIIRLEADLSLLKKDALNNLNFQILTSYYVGSPTEFDDYLKKKTTTETMFTVSGDESAQPYLHLGDLSVSAGSHQVVQLQVGSGVGALIGYYPKNNFSFWDFSVDAQSQILK